jgi:hypothetical protein
VEDAAEYLVNLHPATAGLLPQSERETLLQEGLPEIIRRDLVFKGHLSDAVTFSSRLLAWIESG